MLLSDEFYMKIALQLAAAAEGQTAPNPNVGSVIVKDGEIVGMGAHLKAGEAHAEVHALRMAGDKAKGAVAYVTLEPCSHYGKTPPCADALIEAGVKKVVISSVDSNPLVAGKGIEKLRNAGIEVVSGVLKEEGDRLNEKFFYYIREKKPFVTMKHAITLDGKTATKTGHSMWITSEDARRDVHNDRSKHNAILVGVNTVITDNPSLTNRNGDNVKQPIRIILDTSLRTPMDCKLVQDGVSPTWIVTGSQVTEERMAAYSADHVQIIKLDKPHIDIADMLEVLAVKGITSLYVEGGQAVHASFLQSGFVNQIITYIAPKVVGGADAPGMFADMNITNMNDSYELVFEKVETIGCDLKITSSLK